jgi:hypothetical protein
VRFSRLNREEVDSRDKQQESAGAFVGGDSIRHDGIRHCRVELLCSVSNIVKQLPQKHCHAAKNHACILVSFV